MEADQGVAPLYLEGALDGLDVLQVGLQDAGDLCTDDADHNVAGDICAAGQFLGRAGGVDQRAGADDRAFVLARFASPDSVVALVGEQV